MKEELSGNITFPVAVKQSPSFSEDYIKYGPPLNAINNLLYQLRVSLTELSMLCENALMSTSRANSARPISLPPPEPSAPATDRSWANLSARGLEFPTCDSGRGLGLFEGMPLSSRFMPDALTGQNNFFFSQKGLPLWSLASLNIGF